jgi:hypothetical protein
MTRQAGIFGAFGPITVNETGTRTDALAGVTLGETVSSGAVTHNATGALVGQGSTVAGSSTRFRTFSATGALTGQGSALAGTSARFRAFDASGALVGPGAVIAGSAARSGVAVTHDATGALVGQGAVVTGLAELPSTAPTALIAGPIWHPWGKKNHRRETEDLLPEPPIVIEARAEVAKVVDQSAKLASTIRAMEVKAAHDLAEAVSRATLARREKAQAQRIAKLADLENHVSTLNDRIAQAVENERQRIEEETDLIYVMHILMEA